MIFSSNNSRAFDEHAHMQAEKQYINFAHQQTFFAGLTGLIEIRSYWAAVYYLHLIDRTYTAVLILNVFL